MKFYVLSLFPEYFQTFLQNGVVGSAAKKSLFSLSIINPRDFSTGHYKMVDDIPYGGGDGMVMAYEPMKKALESIEGLKEKPQDFLKIYLSPQGIPLTDSLVRELAQTSKAVVLICGRYSGVDERLIASSVDLEVSIGDYVVSGGELPALVLIDSMLRHIPGVLGNNESAEKDSFYQNLLEAPVFTRPFNVDEMAVPEVLTQGHHVKIKKWRRSLAILRTYQRRLDLFLKANISKKDILEANQILESMDEKSLQISGLKNLPIPISDNL